MPPQQICGAGQDVVPQSRSALLPHTTSLVRHPYPMKGLTSKVLASDPEPEWRERNVQLKSILVGIGTASNANGKRRGESETVLIHHLELNATDGILAVQHYFNERRLSQDTAPSEPRNSLVLHVRTSVPGVEY